MTTILGNGRPGSEYRQFILPQHLTQPGQEQRYHTVYRPQAFIESAVLPDVEQKLLATLPAVRELETPMEIELCIGGSGNFGLTASFDQGPYRRKSRSADLRTETTTESSSWSGCRRG